ncbi:MAG: DNA-directed RNA polymerase subunit beta' [Elusimicrobia bacterium CG_4_9_14_3_um_filter_62_55]|nr:MAG: DNA-directed RNA polymerase subunit beta' [Elusimicrobia bacterium CG22_combo_CG10-13_8_21_14_all_63_91]PJA17068.1 MAG: DNA-directed RNA polymerase subunit beta' [Elusimicrobia bacterium CG_4_10_14_0_2_um_filter_63_34]PJB25099.1 MAG: DNA-directed RNA polymerase subunit beta' [Elusimicrobia bacterium CG_4_9_14_3_um_filter_62_55]
MSDSIATAERKLFGAGRTKKKKSGILDFGEFDAIRLSLASPDMIREWSHGEVKKPETINYRTLKPERDGLFCERIFGPARDFECSCGKYRWIKFKGIVCDRCGVEVTESKVRRERMGSIELAVPVAHIWFLKKSPSRIGIILGMRTSDLERVVYYAMYVVLEDMVEAGSIVFEAGKLMTPEEMQKAVAEYGSKLKIGIGAGALRDLLVNIDPKKECDKMREELKKVASETQRTALVRRLRLLEKFVDSGARPEWMIFTTLPVIPPELRPLVPLEGGRFATSDLNDLYRRIINRNNRLKHIIGLRAPEVMVYNEKRLLQEAVDALIENGARGKVVIGAGNRPLKSLSDVLKGKQGRFRQNLLGKRVDYSGRSVIIAGPELKLYQCGLPKEMALELFKPFIIRELMKRDSLTLKAAKRMFDRVRPEIWDILEEVTRSHPVMLNRAPTLHRLGIQAFEPVLIEGKSIQLHPLTCAAFNADFDGDQMAVHVPLSQEAQLEARLLMLAPHNLLAPSNGKPIATPSHDMVLGINYLTSEKKKAPGEGRVFACTDDVISAYQSTRDRKIPILTLHARIKVYEDSRRCVVSDCASQRTCGHERRKLAWTESDIAAEISRLKEEAKELGKKKGSVDEAERVLANAKALEARKFYKLNSDVVASRPLGLLSEADEKGDGKSVDQWGGYTTIGRVIFNEILPDALSFHNADFAANTGESFEYEAETKKSIQAIIKEALLTCSRHEVRQLLDDLKRFGFHYATLSGLSISIADLETPKMKVGAVRDARKRVKEIESQFAIGAISKKERYDRIIEIWSAVSDSVKSALTESLSRIKGEEYRFGERNFNPTYSMMTSGARGNEHQVLQLAGMRGLMQRPKKKLGEGEIIENPIVSNFREGLTVLEYFVSTHGGRKGLSDTALKTADAGYLTRRLVDVAHDLVVVTEDCGTLRGISVESLEQIKGRVLSQELKLVWESKRTGTLRTEVFPIGTYFDKFLSKTLTEYSDDGAVTSIDENSPAGIRSPMSCEAKRGLCVMCYGINNATGEKVEVGEAVGVISAQSIGEPGTQLTLRTFHTGGAADISSQEDFQVRGACSIRIETLDGKPVKLAVDRDAKLQFLTEARIIQSTDKKTVEKFSKSRVEQRKFGVQQADGSFVKKFRVKKGDAAGPVLYWGLCEAGKIKAKTGETSEFESADLSEQIVKSYLDAIGFDAATEEASSAKADSFIKKNGALRYLRADLLKAVVRALNVNKLMSGVHGIVELRDVISNETLSESRNPITGIIERKIMPSRVKVTKASKLKPKVPRAVIRDASGKELETLILPVDTMLVVEDGQEVFTGDEVGRILFGSVQTKDITAGLPRVSELFEARKPKESAIVSEISGKVSIGTNAKGLVQVTVTDEESEIEREYDIPVTRHLRVYEGDIVRAGDQITDGVIDPHDVLRVMGIQAAQQFLLKGIQDIYRGQGVEVSDKHMECIIRQMIRNVKVTEPGDTDFENGETVTTPKFNEENAKVAEKGGKEAQAEPVLLGITKAALSSESFISAASFQETTRVLTQAATSSQIDNLKGLKENVIIGHMIPAGTGLQARKTLEALEN